MNKLPPRIVVDTNIWIYHTKGIPSANSFLGDAVDAARRRHLDILYSTITEAELFSWPGLTDRDRVHMELLLKLGEPIDVDSAIARKAANIRAALGQAGHKTPKLPDALIAATALISDAAVVSHNRPDFIRVEGLEFIDPIIRSEVVSGSLP